MMGRLGKFAWAAGLVGLASLGFAAPARAVLTIEVRSGTGLAGAAALTVVDNGVGDVNAKFGQISVDTDLLIAAFPTLNFVSLGGSANNVNPNTGAVFAGEDFARLTSEGEVQRLPGPTGGANSTLRVRTSQTDFNTTAPVGTTTQGTMNTQSTFIGTFTDSNDAYTFQGFYNDNNVLFGQQQGSTPLTFIGTTTPDAQSANNGVSGENPFSLTNNNLITIGPSPGPLSSNRPTIQFQGVTIVTGGELANPEPTTVAMVMAGLPMLGFAYLRSRRKRTA